MYLKKNILQENAHAELVFIFPAHYLTLTKWAPRTNFKRQITRTYKSVSPGNTACMTQKNQLSKIRDYDRHKSRACVDLFLKVTRSNILTIIINLLFLSLYIDFFTNLCHFTIKLCLQFTTKIMLRSVWNIKLYRVHLAIRRILTLVVIGTDCTGSCKSNYHTIMTTTAHFLSNIYVS
jgi:hypothetical protein